MKTYAPLAIACSLALASCRAGAKGEERPPEGELWIDPQAIQRGEAHAVAAGFQNMPQAIFAGGRIAFDDERVSHVFSPVTGRVTRVLAHLGERVEKGAALAAILSPDVGSAFSDEVKARADLVAARHELERQQKLFEAKAGPARDLEAAEDNFGKAKAEEDRALQRVRMLTRGSVDAVTQEYLLTSHIAGRVVARMVNPGIEVQGQFSGGTAVELFTVGDIDQVWLYADVAEADLPALKVGAKVRARVLAYPERTFEGRVEWVSATLDPAMRTARIRCTLPNPDGLLKPEMYATVSIERPALRALAVPRDALVRIQEHAFLYVADGVRPDGKQIFRRRLVQIPEHARSDQRGGIPSYEAHLLESSAQDPSAQGPSQDPELVPVLAGIQEGDHVLVEAPRPRPQGPSEVRLPVAEAAAKLAVVEVADQRIQRPITIGGRLTFDDLRVTHVFSPVNGRVTKLLAAPGQRVAKGAPLAILVSPDLGSADSDELKAKADLVAAEHEMKRQREMYALHASASRDLETAQDNYDRARAEHDRAVQKARLLRSGAVDSVSQEFILRSPIDGEVVARMANPGVDVQGQYSGGGSAVELFTIGSIDRLWLLGDVYEVDLPYVKKGAEVVLEPAAYPGRTFRGTVDWVSDALDPATRTAKVRCVLENQQGLLRPEMYQVVTVAAPARRALTVPRDALLRVGDETVVFVEEGKTAEGLVPFRRRRVIADEQAPGDAVPVLGGVKAGERVAAQGSIFLLGDY